MSIFIFCTHPQILLGRSNQGERGGRDMRYAWERKVCVDGRMESEWTLGRLARRGGVECI
jgi:hypothetical protein